MVKLKIIALGKDKDRWVTDGLEHYTKLVSRFAQVEVITIPSPKLSPSMSPDEIKRKEAALYQKYLGRGTVVALSDSGLATDSLQFSQWIEKAQTSASEVTFLIGGPYGLDRGILEKADRVVSLSPLTFSHQVVRLVLMEQLYRAFSISHGTDYHK